MSTNSNERETSLSTPAQARDDKDPTWTALPLRADSHAKEHAFLLVLSGPQMGVIYPLAADLDLTIGRRDDSDLVIGDDGVSRNHATIRVDGEHAILRDLNSANGTYVDGARVSEALLVDGSRVHIGMQTVLKFMWADDLEAEYQRKLAAGALQDPLTGLYNRRMLEDRLASELAAAQRHGRVVSFLMVDIDHFKAVNDRYGHLAGDEALRMVASTLDATVRKEDFLARYGGEEFVIIARETGMEGARLFAERIRAAVENSRCDWQNEQIGVTVSVGVTVSIGLSEFVPGQTERELIDAADRALFCAKQEGRNRVVAMTFEASTNG